MTQADGTEKVTSESPAYPYEPGTSLKDMADTASLEAAQEYDRARSGADEIPYEQTKAFEDDLMSERERDEAQSWVHEQRAKLGQVSPQFQKALEDEFPSIFISNAAYHYREDRRDNHGDTRDADMLKLEFYHQVYPGLKTFLESRVQKDGENPLVGLNEYLDGVDLVKKG